MRNACDVLVVGGGPAGMSAAVAAAEAGRRVILLDDNSACGGQIGRASSVNLHAHTMRLPSLDELGGRLQRTGVILRTNTQVVAQPAPHLLRVEDADGFADLHYERLIVATGARERFLPFPGWTLPGVFGIGGLQAMVKGGLPVAGKRVVLAGSGPLLLAVGAHLAAQGAHIVGIFEQASLAQVARFAAGLARHPEKLIEGARYRLALRNVPYRVGSWVTQAEGSTALRGITITSGNTLRTIDCDYLGCSFHLVPNLELTMLLGCAVENGYVAVDSAQQSSMPGVYCVGELTGIGGLDKALLEGRIAGLAAAGHSSTHLHARRNALLRFARNLDVAFAPRKELRTLAQADTLVCRCEDVPLAALESAHNWREAKIYTRCGMGACQGRICGPAVSHLFGWQHQSIRPPILPASIATLAEPAIARMLD